MRNKIQAPLLVLSNLSVGQEVSKDLVKAALKDVEELKKVIENL